DRQPAADRGLARRRLPGAGLEHLAHDHVPGLSRLDADALERRPDHDRAELRRLEVLEPTAEPPERGADGADDDAARHGASLATGASRPDPEHEPPRPAGATPGA